jgi:hypothetical protein
MSTTKRRHVAMNLNRHQMSLLGRLLVHAEAAHGLGAEGRKAFMQAQYDWRCTDAVVRAAVKRLGLTAKLSSMGIIPPCPLENPSPTA